MNSLKWRPPWITTPFNTTFRYSHVLRIPTRWLLCDRLLFLLSVIRDLLPGRKNWFTISCCHSGSFMICTSCSNSYSHIDNNCWQNLIMMRYTWSFHKRFIFLEMIYNACVFIGFEYEYRFLPSYIAPTGVRYNNNPDSTVHGANMGPTWVLSASDGLHVGPMNLLIIEGLAERTSDNTSIHGYLWDVITYPCPHIRSV